MLYTQMLLNGTLWPHLQDAQKTACVWLERTMTTLLDKYPAPNKESTQFSWVAHMNGLKAQVEEVVVREIVKRTNACLMEDPYWLRFSEDETFEDTTRGRARKIMNENQKSS